MEHHRAWIGLGSNLGPGRATLLAAWEELGRTDGIEISALASPYLTQPEDMASTNLFTNSAGMLAVSLTPDELLDVLLALERRFGRKRSGASEGCGRHEDRSLDLDLLCYDDLILESPRLVLPHPRMHLRRFVLEPLAEIAPDVMHPVLRRTFRQMFRDLQCTSTTGESRRLAWR